MTGTMEALMEQYAAALERYLNGLQEDALQQAYEIGRKAVAEGIGVLDMAAVHNRSLSGVLGRTLTRAEAGLLAGQASLFFAESLSPFEMALRGYREANAQLRSNLQQLELAEQALQKHNQQLTAAHELVEAERQRYQELFHFAPGGYLVTDVKGIIQEANDPAITLLSSRKPLAGQSLLDFVSEADREAFRNQLAKLKSGELQQINDWQVQVPSYRGGAIPVSLRAELVRDREGRSAAFRWLVSDITERKRIEEERADIKIREHIARAESETAGRFRFLAEASVVLASSLDPRVIVTNIARLPVPYLAAFCAVLLTDDQRMVQQAAAVPADAGGPSPIESWRDGEFIGKNLPAPLADVLQRNEPEVITDMEQWRKSRGGELAGRLSGRKLETACLLPLVGHERGLGVIILGRPAGHAGFTATDRDLAVDYARRCSLVLDNAMLHSQVVVERDKANKASQAKDEFVAILSHELRTPLSAILGWVRVLKKNPTVQNDPVLNEGAQTLGHNARNIARLVEDCLDISRITERKIRLQKELIDLNQIVKTALETAREAAMAKDLRFLVHLSPSGLWVSGDRTRLEQVISNLLSNATRYTESGGLISVTSMAVGKEGEISVQDTGMGIAPDLLEQIFQPFRQGTHNWLASESGLGLGLAIARQIVQIHGGKIWAESQGPGSGSSFRLRLPLMAEPQPVLFPSMAAERPEKHDGGQTILFIEDSVDILNLMRIELGELGFSVLTATDGRTGLEIARREHPSIIISDIKMPGMDGYQFVKELRSTPGISLIPVIALTGFGMKKDIDRALAAGYNAHLCKPVEMEQLTTLIKKLAPAASKQS